MRAGRQFFVVRFLEGIMLEDRNIKNMDNALKIFEL